MERNFSEDEANALLPQLVALVTQLQQAHSGFRGAAQSAKRRAASNGSPPTSVAESGSDFAQLLEQINDLGVTVRDAETGLCDFPSLRDGEPIFLCWRLGEEHVGFWHPRDTGFSGRRPL